MEERESINFPALFSAKVTLETYKLCKDTLRQASLSSNYTCPPHLRGKKNLDFFIKRVDEIHKSH